MPREVPGLEALRVASPCAVSWDTMKGDDRVRHCGECRRNVYDLSAMTRADAESLVRRSEGRLCVRFYRRADGTVLTQDCPVGLEAVRRRLRRIARAAAAAFTAILFAGCSRPQAADAGPRDGPTTGLVAPTMGKPAVPIQGDVADPKATMGEVCAPEPPKETK